MASRFITIEGPDGAGKSTQTKMVAKRLEMMGEKVRTIHFPRYDTELGAYIKKALYGKEDIDFKSLQVLYVQDQLNFAQELKRLLALGYNVIADRYDLSTLVYYISKTGCSIDYGRAVVGGWQENLVKPDCTFVLAIEDGKKNSIDGDLDLLEQDTLLMSKVNETYKDICRLESFDREIVCINASMDMLEITDIIMDFLKNKLILKKDGDNK